MEGIILKKIASLISALALLAGLVAMTSGSAAAAVYCDGKLATIVVGSNGPVTVNGTSGADVIYDNNYGNIINGKGGNDTICGNGGADTINAGSGADVVWGGGSGDTIRGGTGNDKLHGGGGNDYVWGEDGADKLWGSSGNDTIYSGTYFAIPDGDVDVFYSGSGSDFCHAENNVDSGYSTYSACEGVIVYQ